MNYADDSAIKTKPDGITVSGMSPEEEQNLLNLLMKWLKLAEGASSEADWRTEAAEDYEFYAGRQDDQEVLARLEALKRPASVYNQVKPKVDMLIGIAAQNRRVPEAFPAEAADEALAELVNGALKHYRKEAKLPRAEIECFEHAAKSGRSLLHFYMGGDDPWNPDIKCKRIPGRDFWLDPLSVEYDLSDARFVFIDKWLDEDEVLALYKSVNVDDVKQLARSRNDLPTFWSQETEKYRITECWYRKYEEVYWVNNPRTRRPEMLSKEEYDRFSKAIKAGITLPSGEKYQSDSVPYFAKRIKRVYYAIFSSTKILEAGRSPYKYEGFPAVLFGAYKDEDLNKWFGAITMMKDPQRGINTMRRQLQHLLQTSPKGILIHEVGAILDIEKYEQNSADPTYHMEVNVGGLEKVHFTNQPQISPVYGELLTKDEQQVKDTSGIQDSLLGIQTSSREPGITVRTRQETGLAVLFLIFDNFRESRFLGTKILLSLMQQYVTSERLIRIEGEEGAKLVQINSQMNRQSQGFNDISSGKFDLVLDEVVENRTIRASIMQMLVEYGQANPGTIPPELVIEYSDLPFTAKLKVKQYHEAQMQREDAFRQQELQINQAKQQDASMIERLKLVVEESIAKLEASVKLQIAEMQKGRQEKGEK